MEIIIAKTAGFCFGVKNAVETVEKLLNEGKKVCVLGEIIHNPKVINDFKNRGVRVIEDPKEIKMEEILVIRAHGITKEKMDYIIENKINFVDATCPHVKKIHKIVESNTQNGEILLIAGDFDHSEVQGICSRTNNKFFIFKNLEELKEILKNNKIIEENAVLVLSQTTFDKNEWKVCVNYIKKRLTNKIVCDTICNATNFRQEEADKLSKIANKVVVIGGKKSSNTTKLFNICSKNANTIFVESARGLKKEDFIKNDVVGIVAGASTPMSDIEECVRFLNIP